MLTHDRHQKILETLVAQQTASVLQLSEKLQVSSATIRTDLNHLARYGHIVRTHGGARIGKERVRQEYTFATRQETNADKKQAISRLAATLIEPRDSILLDASSTAVALVTAIKQRIDLHNLTVVTTGIWTALELLGSQDINVVLTGGTVRSTSGSISGQITLETLSKINLNKVFLGAAGLSESAGATDTHLIEIELKQAIVKQAEQVILLVDSSKWGKTSLATFAELPQISTIVTDEEAPVAMIRMFRKKGIDVRIAEHVKNGKKKNNG